MGSSSLDSLNMKRRGPLSLGELGSDIMALHDVMKLRDITMVLLQALRPLETPLPG